MTPKSILFKNEKNLIEKEPQFFKDLNIDIILNHILLGKKEYNLKPYFYTPLSQKDDILYRQSIMKDLIEIEGLKNSIDTFAQNLNNMRRYLSQEKKLYHKYQKQRWFLDAVDIYIKTVKGFSGELNQFSIQSEGLNAFKTYLTNYTNSEKFIELEKETESLKEGLNSVKYTIFIKKNRVTVQKYKGESDYTKEIEKTFERFRQGDVKNYKIDFYDTASMNHIEGKILDLVASLYDDIFTALSNYYEKNKAFIDPVILSFDREVQFYISYINFMESLKREGLYFNLPQITKTKNNIYIQGGFDMALAYKLKMEKRGTIVCNDFYIKDDERIFIITGANQGGKTTFARMVGQIHYFSALGLPVPAQKAQTFLFDNIFTHFEREEDIKDLRGKLEDDLIRMQKILKSATDKSIIIMNETFSSTTLKDALELGEKILKKILSIGAITLFVTFLDDLTHINKGIVSMVSDIDPQNPTIRTYKILRKPASGLSYALSLAEKYHLTYEKLKERLKK